MTDSLTISAKPLVSRETAATHEDVFAMNDGGSKANGCP